LYTHGDSLWTPHLCGISKMGSHKSKERQRRLEGHRILVLTDATDRDILSHHSTMVDCVHDTISSSLLCLMDSHVSMSSSANRAKRIVHEDLINIHHRHAIVIYGLNQNGFRLRTSIYNAYSNDKYSYLKPCTQGLPARFFNMAAKAGEALGCPCNLKTGFDRFEAQR
ncbi:Hypothetical predicted protein, partial [Paramuricea clavata]